MSEITFLVAAITFFIVMFGNELGFSLSPSGITKGYFLALWILGVSISFQLDKVIKKIKSRSQDD